MAGISFSHIRVAPKMPGVHVHNEHELYYLAKGHTQYLIEDEIFQIDSGHVVFIPKGQYHMTDCGDFPNVERYLLSFDDTLFDSDTRVILEECINSRIMRIPVQRMEGIEALFAKLEQSCKVGGALGEAVQKIEALSILAFICQHKEAFVSRASETDRLLHKVSQFVSTNYSEELSLERLSRVFSVSKSYLCRRFKSVFGMNLNEYITFVRILNAERLLREGTRSITEVACLCGFNDPNYFSTVFKRIKGTTPLKFAKKRERTV